MADKINATETALGAVANVNLDWISLLPVIIQLGMELLKVIESVAAAQKNGASK